MITDPRHYYTGIALEHMLRNDALASASREEIADAAVKMADAVLSRLEMDAEVETDAYGWIEWHGGDCPVFPGTVVDVRHRCSDEYFNCITGLSEFAEDWSHDGSIGDIIAYRIIKK